MPACSQCRRVAGTATIARFDAAPRFAALPPLLEGYGVLVTSAGALAIVLGILGGVVAYIELGGR